MSKLLIACELLKQLKLFIKLITLLSHSTADISAAANIKKPIILGVSVLTSLDDNDFLSLGIKGKVEDQVVRLAKLAETAGLDGLVSSAKELKIIRKELGSSLILVTPGIRLMDGQVNDQKRIVTPSQAINDGANFLVIGRPITSSKDPGASLDHISKVI